MAKLTNYNIAIVAFVCLGAFTYGFAFSVFSTSIGQPGFYDYFELDPSSSYTASILGAVNALFAAGAAVGAISQGWFADILGRKKSFATTALLSLIGGALTAGSVNIPMLITVRFIQGIGLGQIVALVPLYITEVAPAHKRGLLSGLFGGTLGAAYAFCGFVGFAAYYAHNLTVQWRVPLAISCVTPLIVMGGVWLIPESPRWLVSVDRNDDAWNVIKKIHHDPLDENDSAARAEYIQIVKQVSYDLTLGTTYWDMFKKPSWRKRSLTVLFLQFASQSTGVLGINNYSVIIYKNLGLTGSMPLLIYAIYCVIASVGNFASAAVMDRLGRRQMLLIGFPITAGCLLAEALLEKKYVATNDKAGNAAAVFFLFLYIINYAFWVDAPAFVVCAEIWPTPIRAKGIALSFFSYFVGAITYTSPAGVAFKNIGWAYFMVWFSCNVVSTVIVYFFLPETANKTIEEMGDFYGDEVIVHLSADGHNVIEAGKIGVELIEDVKAGDANDAA